MFSPLEQFKVFSIITFGLGRWLDLSFTNFSLALIFSYLIITIGLTSILKPTHAKLVPSRYQITYQLIFSFALNIIREQVGVKGMKYFSLIYTIFVVVLSLNLIGMVPYSLTATSHIVVTFGLSISLFIGITIVGFVYHGLHFLTLFLPSGVPAGLIPLIYTIELISYSTRAFSLGIRLTANMFAGHTLLNIISTFSWQMIMMGGIMFWLGLLPFGLLFFLVGLEILIAFLQAYVFTVLTCSYLNDSINMH